MTERVYTGNYVPAQDGIMDKMIGYQVEIFSYENLFWHPRREKFVVPGGLLKLVMDIDVGSMVADFFLENPLPKIFIILRA